MRIVHTLLLLKHTLEKNKSTLLHLWFAHYIYAVFDPTLGLAIAWCL